MKELKPGEPIPYHKNLGISEAEYAAFIQFSQSVKIEAVGKFVENYNDKQYHE
ncbi:MULTISPECIES: hypothetical protein [Sphingobacterium]|uniref:hypothetical protein n=1 Tax=Sphingobacterium TaxID=28453 RepID=UPI0013E4679C|nr:MULTISPECIES: hypothetical protein [Sphingobacterium]QIH34856.1 hypothetical protein G6053_19005 [Sphingobacterium sp. DR205]